MTEDDGDPGAWITLRLDGTELTRTAKASALVGEVRPPAQSCG